MGSLGSRGVGNLQPSWGLSPGASDHHRLPEVGLVDRLGSVAGFRLRIGGPQPKSTATALLVTRLA
jgi:hypothetical protein